jgi:nucleotide-binding universal stress UspA family protein
MFEKILVAIDLSDMGRKVFARALSLAQGRHSSLLLLHVLSAEEEGSPLPIPPDLSDLYPAAGNDLTLEVWRQQWQTFEQQGFDVLRSLSLEATNTGVRNEFQQISGSPGRLICQVARDTSINLIIIGHRGRSGLSEMLLGSVSNYVLHYAPCSVLIVQ